MIAQFILTALLLGVALYAWQEHRRSPVVGTLSMVAATTAIYLVWAPSHASDLAEFAGVGRGVDLIIYIWVVISLLVLLNLHLKLRVQLELITALARQIAIANASPAANTSLADRPSRADEYQPATSSNPPIIMAIPAKSRADSGSANHSPPSSGVIANASATNG
jgi:small membrane protein